MPTAPPALQHLLDVVRSDCRREAAAGRRPRVRDYAASLPELFADPAAAELLADLEAELEAGPARTPPPARVLDLDRTRGSVVQPAAPPEAGEGPVPFPQVGDTVAGFRLTGELGRGTFGRVFRAEQLALAGRPVALKVTARGSREAQKLARLRHTNVVPVHSVHDLPGLQAVCMPVLGTLTLADLVADLRRTGSFAGSAAGTVAWAGDSTLPAAARPAEAPPPLPPGVVGRFAGRSHVGRVLWLAGRLAGGLQHAHEAGILHLDLKPANVLLADDGEPVLLDFNLSLDVRTRDRDRAGGTLPYMAPEQLDDYRAGGPPRVDPRTDLFGLGAMLFELLTGRQPFPAPAGRPDLRRLAADRRAGPPPVRPLNRQVPAAVEAIVRKLLAPDPAARYQSAAALLDDLQAQQADYPLKHAPDRSVRERAGKWRRRHPRAWVPAALAASLLVSGGLGWGLLDRAAAAALADARGTAAALLADLPRLRADLSEPDGPTAAADRAAALQRGADLLAGYGLPADPDWLPGPALHRLPAGERAAAQDALGELALLLAHAETLGRRTPDPAAFARARDWNRTAEAAFAGRPLPRAVADQRKRLGPDLPPPAAPAVDVPAIDLFFQAADARADRRPTDALPPLEELCRLRPDHFAAQYALADCRQRTADGLRAAERFAVAAALRPDDPRPHYHRGRLLLVQQRPAEAVAALTEAVDRRPADPDARVLRATARLRAGDAAGAAADVRAARAAGGAPATLLPLQAEALQAAGDAAGAAAARAEAVNHDPASPVEFLLRGRGRLPADPAGALADFRRATELDPTSGAAWLSLAHVLGDRLDRPREALAAADTAVGLDAANPQAWVGRAVIRARLGDRQQAHADADRAAQLGGDPLVLVLAAGAYARTSPAHPADADRAAELLRRAVRLGFRDRHKLRTDPDLQAVRNRPDVRALLDD